MREAIKHVAFLRALNVGGRIVRMQELAAAFTSVGIAGVETFLASGNVLFEAAPEQIEDLHSAIEDQFKSAFSFESQVFIRSSAEIAAIAALYPFLPELTAAALTNCVGFTRNALPTESVRILQALGSEADQFQVHGSEIYWLDSNSQSDPSFTLKQLEKALGVKATFRGMNTIKRLAKRM